MTIFRKGLLIALNWLENFFLTASQALNDQDNVDLGTGVKLIFSRLFTQNNSLIIGLMDVQTVIDLSIDETAEFISVLNAMCNGSRTTDSIKTARGIILEFSHENGHIKLICKLFPGGGSANIGFDQARSAIQYYQQRVGAQNG